MSEIDVYTPRDRQPLPAKIQYAKVLADSGLLPTAYRRNPANVLYAVEYGEMLGLSPMAAITGIHIIEGKPTASAGLISALVRRAGHKLRVKGDNRSATCQIIRSDDPDYTFEVTWTLHRNSDGNPSAEEAGLVNKSVWRNYAASMLKARAITQCARDACEEALSGIHYTPEELGAEVDEEGNVVGEPVTSVPPQEPQAPQADEPVDAEIVDEAIPAPGADTTRLNAVPDDDQWYTEPPQHEQPHSDAAWLDGINADIDAIASKKDGETVWAKIVAGFNTRACTPADRRGLEAMVAAKVAAVMGQQQAGETGEAA